ncbi:sensor domain-containing protein [Streptomyces sp. RFCAC02]|uniref:sensor domain-containing protein n=1 Tax=Streptomyces sp. RFCAC02 TaxID=2499143 RepID=UPI001F10889D|nr:sensor domain-containing protein [Streptomyces sp. RFCAC02]
MTHTATAQATTAAREAVREPAARGETGGFGGRLGYLLLGLPFGIAAFTATVVALSLGAAGFVLVAGMPVLIGALSLARAPAGTERRRVARVTGRPVPEPRYREPEGHGMARWLSALGDPQAWRDVLHAVVSFPLRVTGFCFALTWTLGGLAETLYATWSWSLPKEPGENGLLDLAFGIDSTLADIAFNTAIGLLILATARPVVRGMTALQTGLSRALLAG